jgi:hypothetical protein
VLLVDVDGRALRDLALAGARRVEPAAAGGAWVLARRAGTSEAEIHLVAARGGSTLRYVCAEVVDLDADPRGRLALLARAAGTEPGPVRLVELDPAGGAARLLAELPGARALAAGARRILVVTGDELVALDPRVPPAVVARRRHGGGVLGAVALGDGFALLERRAGDSLVLRLGPGLETLGLASLGDAGALRVGETSRGDRILGWREKRGFVLDTSPPGRAPRALALPSGAVDVLLLGERTLVARLGALVVLGPEGALQGVRGGFRGLASLCAVRPASAADPGL